VEFGQHLDGCYRRVWDDDLCIIYELSAPRPSGAEKQ
jgi:hypothetical protein